MDGLRYRLGRRRKVDAVQTAALAVSDEPAAGQLREVAADGPDVVQVAEGEALPALRREVLTVAGLVSSITFLLLLVVVSSFVTIITIGPRATSGTASSCPG